jgi:hypothetical protein
MYSNSAGEALSLIKQVHAKTAQKSKLKAKKIRNMYLIVFKNVKY